MYETLIEKIKTTLESVPQVKLVFSVPKANIEKYPAVFFKPAGFTNEFATQRENMKVYRFTMIVIIGANENKNIEQIFATTLPKTVDAIVAKFDAEWNQGTIEGHRVWTKIDSADEWQISEEENGLECYAPLNVEIRLLSNT